MHGIGDTEDQAECAREELARALAHAGVLLPSLTVDVAPWPSGMPALVDLGRCNARTARALATALLSAPEAR
ncbi:hypothetical protein [Streptomyces sulphureus]|uniref:hypothetical protein n=1 Tax=Streptomyces sulphureus TaxID=47758 RepID=UPI00036CD6CE|nr:hypothetical protein [Streptomyces sulphureus]